MPSLNPDSSDLAMNIDALSSTFAADHFSSRRIQTHADIRKATRK